MTSGRTPLTDEELRDFELWAGLYASPMNLRPAQALRAAEELRDLRQENRNLRHQNELWIHLLSDREDPAKLVDAISELLDRVGGRES